MKKTKQQRRLQASNAAHKALQNRAIKRGEEHKQLYHGACILQQEKNGRYQLLFRVGRSRTG